MMPLFNFQLSAQENGKLRGIVTDATSGEALAFGNVLIKELGTGSSTDTKGYFMIPSMPANKIYTITVSYVGYESKTIEVFIAENKITQIEIGLNPTGIELQTIEKIGDRSARPNETNISLQKITVQDLERIPRGVEMDILRSLQYLPGVSSFGDASARYNVRGGASNQNLVLLDGVTIYNPFHALGMFSVIDPELINSIEFFKGGFPPEYGGRLSSVLKISTKQGNQLRYGGAATASFLTAKALIEGPIPYGSFIVTGRKSHSSGVLKKFLNDKDAPVDFYDLSFRLTYHNADPDFIDNSKWTIHGFFSRDNLVNESPLKEDFKWSNNLIGLKRFQVYDTPLYSELSISMSEFKGELISKLSNARPRKNELQDFTVRMDFNYIYDNRNELGVGMIFNAVETKLFLLNGAGVFTELEDFGANISVYFKYKFLKYKNFGADLGIRINLEGLKERGNFFSEPRINMTYRVTPEIALKGAWGIFQQGLTTISDENEVVSIFEPWFLTPAYLNPARASHYNIGLETNFSKYFTFDIEGYYKSIKNLPVINREKQFSSDPDLVAGDGESYGWEFLVTSQLNRLRFTGSYTLSWAYNEVEGWKYYPRYDSRHAVKLLFEYNLGEGWLFSGTWLYNTGYPFTPSIGYYDRLNSVNFVSWDIYESYAPFLLLGDRNVFRLPNYHRMDIGIPKNLSSIHLNSRLILALLTSMIEKTFSTSNVIQGKS